MVLDLCGGEPSDLVIAGTITAFDKTVDFPPSEVRRLTGIDVSEVEMNRILAALGFAIDAAGDRWTVRVPSWRPDIEGKADLVEEITRIVGLDKLPTATLPLRNAVEMPKITVGQNRRRLARRALAARGLDEAVTWSFTEERHAALFSQGKEWLAQKGLRACQSDFLGPRRDAPIHFAEPDCGDRSEYGSRRSCLRAR